VSRALPAMEGGVVAVPAAAGGVAGVVTAVESADSQPGAAWVPFVLRWR